MNMKLTSFAGSLLLAASASWAGSGAPSQPDLGAAFETARVIAKGPSLTTREEVLVKTEAVKAGPCILEGRMGLPLCQHLNWNSASFLITRKDTVLVIIRDKQSKRVLHQELDVRVRPEWAAPVTSSSCYNITIGDGEEVARGRALYREDKNLVLQKCEALRAAISE